ncbi:MAG TPA: SURF1 family protein [Stellaceae bacterium]|nr:SURF1 family protein [Stellaceae bacterium]
MSVELGAYRLGLWPTLITLPLVVLCLALGVWQIQRLHWKEGLIAERAATLQAPPVAPPASLAQAKRLELRRTIERGVLLNDKEILVHAIAADGAAGFDVLTPLREPGGRSVFINRGFVPTALRDPAARPAAELRGTVQIAGRIVLPASPGLFVPGNQPDRGDWYRINIAAMAKADRLADVAPFYIDADQTPNPGGWPEGGTMLPELPNHHLQYAITWFSLAAIGVYIYFKSQRQPRGAAT